MGISTILTNINISSIDLDNHMKEMITGEWGRWFILRSYDLTRKSKWWDPHNKEAIGGPAYEFKDYLVRGRLVPKIYRGASKNYKIQDLGELDFLYSTLYLTSNIPLKDEDDVMEIAETTNNEPPSLVHVTRQHKIRTIDRRHDGKLIYSKSYTYYKTAIKNESIPDPLSVDATFWLNAT